MIELFVWYCFYVISWAAQETKWLNKTNKLKQISNIGDLHVDEDRDHLNMFKRVERWIINGKRWTLTSAGL